MKGKKMRLDDFSDSQMEFEAFLGETDMKIEDILNINKGDVIDLNRPAGDACDIYISNRAIGKGEIMVFEKNLAVRVSKIIDSGDIFDYETKG